MARLFAAPSSRNSTYYRQFDCGDVFHGLVVETEIDNVDTLSKFRGVANVWPMKTVPMTSAIQRVKAASEPKYHNYSMHQWTGVDQLHAQGIRGKGATIAIIDTGVDYTHEAVRRPLVDELAPCAKHIYSLAGVMAQAAKLLEVMILSVQIVRIFRVITQI